MHPLLFPKDGGTALWALNPTLAFGGLGLILFATFKRKQDSPALVLSYAALEGLFLGAFSFVIANFYVADDVSAGALISQAVLGTFGVFFDW